MLISFCRKREDFEQEGERDNGGESHRALLPERICVECAKELPTDVAIYPLRSRVSNWVSLDQKLQPFVINNLHVNYVIMERMDKTIRAYPSLDAMKADEYRDWQERPAHERMSAVKEITLAIYQMKEPAADVRRLQRTLVHLPRPRGYDEKNMATLDWSQCPAVESIPGKVSGAWVFRNTRMPVQLVFENLSRQYAIALYPAFA